MIMIHDPQRTQDSPEGQGAGERVAKALARAGVASRRDVERLIEAGRVAINGKTLTTPGVKVEPGDILTVDGEVVNEAEPARLFRYHKPVGLVTTHKDPQGRPTVFEALPPELPRLISVGRLDLNSEGLLLLTNDGELARALEMPNAEITRRYRARAHGRITQERLDVLKDGVVVEGVRYGAIEARLDKAKDGPSGANLWITVTLAEGKNREIRRVLEYLGLQVNRLIRLSYGPFALGTLREGEVEEVGPRVIREQLAAHIEPDNMPKGDRPQYMPKRRPGAGRRAPGEPDPGLVAAAQEPSPAARSKEKPEYKSGWAKPKKKVGHAAKTQGKAPSKPGPAVIGPGKPRGDRPRPVVAAAERSRAETGLNARGTRDRPAKSAPRDAAAAQADKPRSAPARSGAPRPAYAGKPRPASADKGPPGLNARGTRDRPAKPAPRPEGPRPDKPRAERPAFDRPDHAKADRPRPTRSDRPTSDKPRPERSFAGKPAFKDSGPPRASARPASERPKSDKPGPERSFAGKPEFKGSGSPRADARPSGPRGPKGSSSPRQSSDARPSGPRPGGGPKRRG